MKKNTFDFVGGGIYITPSTRIIGLSSPAVLCESNDVDADVEGVTRGASVSWS